MKKRITFMRIGQQKTNGNLYYQVSFGSYIEVAQDDSKVFHPGTTIFVSKEEYELMKVGDEIVLLAA